MNDKYCIMKTHNASRNYENSYLRVIDFRLVPNFIMRVTTTHVYISYCG